MFNRLSNKLKSIAKNLVASVTFSLPYEHEKKVKDDLAKHKSPEELKIEERFNAINTEWASIEKQKEAAQKFKNEDKVKEYDEKLKVLYQEYRDLDDKKYDLEEKSEYSAKVKEHLPEVNYSQDNAAAVLKSLGYQMDGNGGVLNVHDLMQKITSLRNSGKKQKEMSKHTREPIHDESPGQARIYSPGFDVEDILSRVDRLETLAKKALELGIDEIHYG